MLCSGLHNGIESLNYYMVFEEEHKFLKSHS